MKVLHLLSSDRISGAENVVADIILMYKKDIEMLYASPNGTIKQSLEDRKVNYYPMKKNSISEIRKAIIQNKPDIIHAHDFKASIAAALISKRIPLISHLHVNSEDLSKVNLKTWLYKKFSYKFDKVICVSDSILKDFIYSKYIEDKSINLRNIIYSPRITQLINKDKNEYNFDFVYVGRLSYQKNPQRVAEVAAIVLKKLPNSKFGVIGEGEFKKEMEIIFKREGVSNQVTFTGNLPYPYKAISQSKCLLMCSRFEGTPIVALEAMSLGIPIVSTPVDGMIELMGENNTEGYLGSNNKALAEAVIELIMDEEIQNEKSSKIMSKFNQINDIENYEKTLKKIYHELLN